MNKNNEYKFKLSKFNLDNKIELYTIIVYEVKTGKWMNCMYHGCYDAMPIFTNDIDAIVWAENHNMELEE